MGGYQSLTRLRTARISILTAVILRIDIDSDNVYDRNAQEMWENRVVS